MGDTMIGRLAFRIIVFVLFALGGLTSAAAQAPGSGAFSGFQSNSDDPIQIEADRLEVQDEKAEAIFKGNVKVVQGTTVLTTKVLRVYYLRNGEQTSPGQNSQIERLVVSGGVHIRTEDQVATADSGSFNMKTEMVELVGNVVLIQGENIAKGCKLIANLKTGVSQLESRDCPGSKESGGRIKILLTPSSNSEQ